MVIPKRNGSSLSLKLLNSAPLWVFARISVPLLFVIVDLKLSLSLSGCCPDLLVPSRNSHDDHDGMRPQNEAQKLDIPLIPLSKERGALSASTAEGKDPKAPRKKDSRSEWQQEPQNGLSCSPMQKHISFSNLTNAYCKL